MRLSGVGAGLALAALAGLARAQGVPDPAQPDGAAPAPADPCAANFDTPRELGLHVAAIFIQVALSLTGTAIPIALQRLNIAGRFTDFVFEGIRNFGTGIILATGFIHMLLPAVSLLTSPCLPPIWNTDYVAFAGVFAIAGILTTQFFQFVAISFLTGIRDRAPPAKPPPSPSSNGTAVDLPPAPASTGSDHSHDSDPESVLLQRQGANGHAHHGHGHGHGARPVLAHAPTDPAFALVPAGRPHAHPCHDEDDGHGHLRDALFAGNAVADDLRKKQVTVYLLEAGVASHSFFVGLVLGTTRGAELRALMVALAFHQFFEGMALSATLLDAKFKSRAPAIMMVVLYTVITPLGVAVGVALNESYNPNSQAALLTQGILDAFSAGVLIYDSLVNLLHVNVTSNHRFHQYPVAKKTFFFALFYAGITVMAIIGRYA